jgi:predicted TIM-barrel fold metal-dependent hydrolase
MSNLTIISADCHAGALPDTYREYLPARLREHFDDWWTAIDAEMKERRGTFFDFDSTEERERVESVLDGKAEGEHDAVARALVLDADGIAGEIIFPQMAPFGAGLMQYRREIDPEWNLEGTRAYNRWLADLCNTNPGRHAGVALITVEDIDVSIQDVTAAKEMGLWGGVLIPAGTGDNEYYHHPRYEPLWAACEEMEMPIHTHSGWSPDYGDVPSATAMFISEVSWYAHRPFTCFLWAGVFERYPKLKLVMTEQGTSWVLDTMRMFERNFDSPYFKYFHKDLSLRPLEYFQRQCFLGASFLTPGDCALRHEIGVDRLMWGSDYPHLEGTWPNTMSSLRETFGELPENETRAMLGETALDVFAVYREQMKGIAEKIGPTLSDIQAPA